MSNKITELEASFKKKHVVDVQSGDTVRVHQRIKEGNKERVQVFEGLVIRTRRQSSHTATFTVRRIASGIGVEKTFMIHSPFIEKIEVVKRSKVRRNYLSYMRQRSGKSARLAAVDFDRKAVNAIPEVEAEEAPSEDVDMTTESAEKVDEPKEEKSEA